MSDEYHMHMPSGKKFDARLETPISIEDKAWLHKLIDLILDETMVSGLSDGERRCSVLDGARLAEALPVERALEISEMVRALGFPEGSDDLKRYALLLRELEIDERFGTEAVINGH